MQYTSIMLAGKDWKDFQSCLFHFHAEINLETNNNNVECGAQPSFWPPLFSFFCPSTLSLSSNKDPFCEQTLHTVVKSQDIFPGVYKKTLNVLGPHHVMYGHNIVVRLHGFFCTLYTIIYVRFLYPICTPYVGYMKSKIFQKSQNKAKIGQKSQIFQKNQKKPKKPNLQKKPKIIQNLAFLSNFGFFGKLKLFWNFLDFLEIFVFFGTSLLFVISEAT
jgi:hypothetical protein